MDLIKLYKKRRYIIKTAVLVLIIIIAGIFYINPTKEDGSVIINKDNISDKESDSKSIIGGVTSGGAADVNNSNGINGNEAGNDGLDENNSKIYVYICGAVVNAGVVSGGAGMRLYQAVELCGGFIDEADGTRVNLAMQLKDGDKIYIPYAYDDISLTDEMNNSCNPNATEYRAVIQRIQTVIAKVMVVTQGEQAVVILLILIKLPSLNLCSYPA